MFTKEEKSLIQKLVQKKRALSGLFFSTAKQNIHSYYQQIYPHYSQGGRFMAGQIISRGKDKWLVRVFLGRDKNGKRKYHNKTIHGNKKEAQKYLNAVLREKDMGTFEEPAKMTINEYLDHWLETSAKGKVRPQTFEGYKKELRLYIRPYLGEYKLNKLNALTIQSVYKAHQEERGLAPATIRRPHVIFSSALSQAVKWGMIPKNPCEHVVLPRKERKEMNVLTPEEARIFLEAAVYDRRHALICCC
jgi:hypothetical protein